MSDALLKNTFNKISPAYELVADVTVATATTQVDFSGLNFGKDDDLLLVSDFKSAISNPFIYFNDNTTPTNYYYQRISADNTTIGSVRANISLLGTVDANQFSLINTNIKLTNAGYLVWQSHENRSYGTTTITNQIIYGTCTFTSTSITKISINAGTNGISVGSRFQLYRLKAKKIADIIVSSATTQVDITGLDIDKDSEYMLVSDCVHNGNTQFRLYANANYTDANYYTQYMVVASTSVSSNRVNYPYLTYNESGLYSLNISTLKLTNNGYIISQNNIVDKYSSNLIGIRKAYITSTFTTTSITSLRVASDIANGIGIGSRFTLYKLR